MFLVSHLKKYIAMVVQIIYRDPEVLVSEIHSTGLIK